MIRHIVLIRFRDDVSEAKIAALWDELTAIKPKIEGLLDFHAGRSESPEKIERGYLHGFTVDFLDWDALARYQEHPDHKALGAGLVAHAEGGLDGILVFDLPSGA
ncbi:MAG: Dabb family protein [Pseudomonadota bacterium]